MNTITSPNSLVILGDENVITPWPAVDTLPESQRKSGNSAIAGWANTIHAYNSFVLGEHNIIGPYGNHSCVFGYHNHVEYHGGYSIVGGSENKVIRGAAWSTVWGYQNIAQGGLKEGEISKETGLGWFMTIAGGRNNMVCEQLATVGGGADNTADGIGGVIGGGKNNLVKGRYATVPGGQMNRAIGNYSFAGGWASEALHDGSFVWSDSTAMGFRSEENDQFAIQATGGVWFSTGRDGAEARLLPGGAYWSASVNSESVKAVRAVVNNKQLLDAVMNMPVYHYSFKAQGSDVKHVGVMAEAWSSLGLEGNGRTINVGDQIGVLTACVQALLKRIEKLEQTKMK